MATKQATVYYSVGGTASATTDIDIPDGADVNEFVDAVIDQASQNLNTGLCWSCAGKVDTGDPEPTEVTIDGETVWEDRPASETYAAQDGAKAAVEQFREALAAHFERDAGSPTSPAGRAVAAILRDAAQTIRNFQPPA